MGELAPVGGSRMRMLRTNQTPLWYQLYRESDTIYVRDENGNIVYHNVDGEDIPLETGKRSDEYDEPVKFYGKIQSAGGAAEALSYGVSDGSYQAKLLEVADGLPIKEMSLIWMREPDGGNAEYRVVRKPVVLNQVVYLLKRNE